MNADINYVVPWKRKAVEMKIQGKCEVTNTSSKAKIFKSCLKIAYAGILNDIREVIKVPGYI